jgi:membrane protein
LAFYFSIANPASVYGVAGSVILVLLWVSYSSMILFFGAEFTAAYAKIYTGTVPPSQSQKEQTVKNIAEFFNLPFKSSVLINNYLLITINCV